MLTPRPKPWNGHDGQHLVAHRPDGVCGDDLRGQGVEIEVGQQDALGDASCAAAVEDDRGIVGLAGHAHIPCHVPSVGDELLPQQHIRILGQLGDLSALGQRVANLHDRIQRILDGSDDQVLEGGGVLADGREFAVELIQRQRRHGLGIVKVEFDFALGGQRVHHVGDGAHHVHRVEHHHGLRRVGHADGDAVTLFHADFFQRLRAGVDLLDQSGIQRAAAHEIAGNDVGMRLRDALHRFDHRALEVIQVHRHFAHPGRPGRLDSAHQ